MPNPPALSPDQLRELTETLLDFEAEGIERGDRYLKEGRVGPVVWDADDQELRADVTGSSVYRTCWSWAGDALWESDCTCPVGGYCKHAYAVGKKVLEQVDPRGHLPTAANATSEAAGTATAPRPVELGPLLEHLHKRGLKQAEQRSVREIEQMHAATCRTGTVDAEAIYRFARPTNPGLLNSKPLSNELLEEVFERRALPETPQDYWKHLAVVFKKLGWRTPSLFEPVSDTAELEAQIAKRQELQELKIWRTALEKLGNDAGAEPPAERKRLRVALRPKGLYFQLSSSDEEFADIAPGETASVFNSERFAAMAGEWDTPSVLLAGLFDEHFRSNQGMRPNLRSPEVAHSLGIALLHPDLEGRVVDQNGEPFARSDRVLVWQFTDDSADPRRAMAGLAFEDGGVAPQPLLHLAGPPHLYLSGNTCYRGPAPLHAGKDAGWKVSIPVAALHNEAVVRSLARARSKLPESVEKKIERVELRPRLRASLGPGREGDECVLLSLAAVDAAETPQLALTDKDWVDSSVGVEDGRVRLHDVSGLERVREHFLGLHALWDLGAGHWEHPTHQNTPGELYAWLGGFPADTIIELSPELAGLRAQPVRADFALQIEESGRDWFDVELVMRTDDGRFTKEELELLLKAEGRWVRLKGKGWQRLALAFSEDLERKLADLGLGAGDALPGRQRFHALQLAAAGVGEVVDESVWEAVQARADAIKALPFPAVPAGFTGELRPYQTEGFHFLAHLSSNGLGGILADDMGLGKTVQALVWLLWLADRQDDSKPLRALVVCPKSVMTNWERETARFAPRLSAASFRPKESKGLPETNIVVANYAQLRFASALFLETPWTAVILDEGQNIKNPQSQTAGLTRKLKADHCVVLTGTPIENRVLDIWSLFAFAMPGLLGGQAQFKRLYDDRKDPAARGRLARRVRHFLLRRTKGQVASDLPPRIEEDVFCELEDEQQKLYQAELKRARQMVLGIEDPQALDAQRFNILQSLLRLRQICCHPALVGDAFANCPSAKVSALFEQIEPILEEGHKVLVFSQFVSVLEILQRELLERKVGHLILTGKTENRAELVDRFQEDPSVSVFLLSLRAAGSGLNLTAASYVVLFDPWWNPAVEAQAIDRTHRIGQANQVIAYRLIAIGTVEEKIRQLQKEKASLAAAVVQEESLASVLDLDDLKFVLS